MAALSKIGTFLKNIWAKEPVIAVSFAIGLLAVTAPWISPLTKYSGMINEATPYVYPAWEYLTDDKEQTAKAFQIVPVRDDGNMPEIPSHPCDKEGPSLEWLKNF